MSAGFDCAKGEIIIPLDADGQNDPADIPALVKKLNEGYDIVSGWRKDRKDRTLTRKIPSMIANRIIGWSTGVKLHDYGCSLKAYRREVLKMINLYGEMHRFIPAIASWSGAKITEIVVNHRPRTAGVAKYGLERTVKVILDLMTVKFLGSYSTKPIYIFGGLGFLSGLASIFFGLIVLYMKYISHQHLPMNRNPLLMLSAILVITTVQFILMGLLAEMIVRTYHESQKRSIYVIRNILDNNKAE
jgi:glycosyltransferase involved in cell wall biosynthesis